MLTKAICLTAPNVWPEHLKWVRGTLPLLNLSCHCGHVTNLFPNRINVLKTTRINIWSSASLSYKNTGLLHGFFLPFLCLSGFLPLTTGPAPAALTALPPAGCACWILLTAGFPLLPCIQGKQADTPALPRSGPWIPSKPCRKFLVFVPAHQTPHGDEAPPVPSATHVGKTESSVFLQKWDPPGSLTVELAFNSHHWKEEMVSLLN